MPDIARSAGSSRSLIRLGVVLVCIVVLSAVLAVRQLRVDANAAAETANRQLGVVLAEQTARAVQAVDLVLAELAQAISRDGVRDQAALHQQFGTRWMHEVLARRLPDLPQVGTISILDSDGRLVNMTISWPFPDTSFADRSHFRHFAEAEDGQAFIGEPVTNRFTGEQTVFVARGLRTAEGDFLGIVSAAIRLDYFARLFEAIALPEGTAVTILRSDGLVLLHSRGGAVAPGQRVSVGSPWYQMAAAGGGHYHLTQGVDGRGPRLVSVQPHPDYPLVVHISQLDSAVFAQWRRQTVQIALWTLGVVLVIGLGIRALSRQLAVMEAAQTRIRDSEARLQATLDHMNQGIILVDAAGIVTVCNQRAMALLDWTPETLATRPTLRALIAQQQVQGEFGTIPGRPLDAATLLDPHADYERRRPNGTVLEIRSKPMPGGGMVRSFTDITARAAAEEMLGLAASHDQLTGLANRNGFQTRLDAALAAAQRGNSELVVMCLDLDRFKVVNDTLGHAAGDQLLSLVAQRLRTEARESDILARLGGDEFAVVLPGTGLAGAERLAQRLLEVIREPYRIGEAVARIGVSIGIASYPADGGTAEQLLHNADSALYQAKEAGRNRWCCYATADGEREQNRIALERDLREAVELQQFTLAYQPICDAASGRPTAFEALLRWHHPSRGAISPAEFIPLAEANGLIVPLGRWVIETACAEAATWALPMRVAINLSPAQFRDHRLLDFVTAELARSGLPASRLDLEVTEGLLLEDTREVIDTMQALRRLGARMVLDDFGTAHSSLSYLRGFPFDSVKIDRSFMRALNSDRQARALVEAMLAMARALELEVVGEGVETPEQLALLRHLGCARVQGYLLGRPASATVTREKLWALAGQASQRQPLAVG